MDQKIEKDFQEVTYFDCRTQSEVTLTLDERGRIIQAEMVFQEPLPLNILMSPIFEGIMTPQNIKAMTKASGTELQKTVTPARTSLPCGGCGK